MDTKLISVYVGITQNVLIYLSEKLMERELKFVFEDLN